MTLPVSGTLSINDIRTEFGVSTSSPLGIFYRGGIFVPNSPTNAGVPTSGQISISNFYGASAGPQPNSWTAGTTSNTFGLTHLAYYTANNIWVGVGNPTSATPTIFTSTDGMNWTQQTSPSPATVNYSFGSSTYQNSTYFIVGGTDLAATYVATSPNGTTWTTQGVVGGTPTLATCDSQPGRIVATSGLRTQFSNATGTSWSPSATLFPGTQGRNMIFAGGLYWCGCNISSTQSRILTSPDGSNWTSQVTFTGPSAITDFAVNNTLLVVTGNNGFIANCNTGNPSLWNVVSNPFAANANIRSVAYGNGKYVAVGSKGSGTINNAYSGDGSTWIAGASLPFTEGNYVGFGNGLFACAQGFGFGNGGMAWSL